MELHPSIFKNIWFVDDDEDDHLVFEIVLNSILPTANLTHLNKCDELLAALNQSIPDLIFLDLHLPGMNGKICLKELRERKEFDHIPVIVYSASNYPIDINVTYGYGATLYLIKPHSLPDLEIMLRHVFSLNWDDPKSITDKQFVGDRFVPFSPG
jgi:CheY-like chemotaxis protein